ncbi:hypothetical protein METBIDRAFT_79006 [Metschnikowia bicuspidata var. bicuspidata NRRL YB-4993]|uniref:Large ribosomal subunit protein mL40 n=1 Tax=Metschnikowia bicuspidata var. bicuspidata NRRL YB-4993 TaxID=869754 RepID=A0A1A0HA20_9ASCO|nr:hypothetical protein METBIDRAFT_79006 [Metschnikowia bicuspidata var. bicuspidata NRRL YB-4993]OBA20722.1 hypothetical protein METBIDRAFT_79006 [Metschnikowia bicuspidata var. bicuspidata NRRL YB-4993]
MISRLSAGRTPQLHKLFVRGKKTTGVSPSTQKVVNQLSALSATKKQPKLLKLCAEDLIKHKTITNAWKIFSRKQHAKSMDLLEKQYNSIRNAMDELKEISPDLYEAANKPETMKRFPLDMRVPTDFPANKPWVYDFEKNASEAK